MLLPVVLLAVLAITRVRRAAVSGEISLPSFVIAFLAFVLLDSTGLVPTALYDAASIGSQ